MSDFDELREEMRASRSGGAPDPTLAKYVDDAIGYADDVLGVELTAIQKRMLLAIQQNPRTAIAAGHRTGRTMVFAVALLWWCDTRDDAVSLLSTPSQAQMRGTIWRELGDLIRNARRPLRMRWFELPSRGVQYDCGNLIIGVASDTGERLQGYAAAHLLIVVDEAAGYPETMMPSLMSNLAGGGKAAIGGNPTNNDSYFAKRWKVPGWVTMNVSSLEVANSPDRKPGQATPEWCAEMLEENGADSPIYRARVLGLFSSADAYSVFSLDEIEQATRRYDEIMSDRRAFESAGPLEIGLDVARSGADSTVAVARRGHIALAPQVWRIPDLVMVADRAVQYAIELRQASERPVMRVDGVGIGAGVVDQLKRSHEVAVVEIQAAAMATRSEEHTNVRSEMTFLARDWVRAGGCFARDAKLEGEMCAVRYAFDRRNRIKIRSKDELRSELGRSTDRFDALALAVYSPTADFDIGKWARLQTEAGEEACEERAWHREERTIY